MTANVSAKALVGAVKIARPDAKFSSERKQKKNLVSGFYFIRRKTVSGNLCDVEIAYFHRAEEGRSLYLGKWQIFDRLSSVYHKADTVQVIAAISLPVVE